MKGKIALVTGAALGYVLGTKAGRQRYEQIKSNVASLWQDPRVQSKVSEAQEAMFPAQAAASDLGDPPAGYRLADEGGRDV